MSCPKGWDIPCGNHEGCGHLSPPSCSNTCDPSAVNEATEHGNAAGAASPHTSPHHHQGGWKGTQGGACSLHPLGTGFPRGCTTWPSPGETGGGWRSVCPGHEPRFLPARREMQRFPPRSIEAKLGAGAGSFQVNRRIRLWPWTQNPHFSGNLVISLTRFHPNWNEMLKKYKI